MYFEVTFQTSMTFSLDQVIRRVYHSSTYRPNFIQIGKLRYGRTSRHMLTQLIP